MLVRPGRVQIPKLRLLNRERDPAERRLSNGEHRGCAGRTYGSELGPKGRMNTQELGDLKLGLGLEARTELGLRR